MRTERERSIFAQVVSGKIKKIYKTIGQAKDLENKHYAEENTSRRGIILSRNKQLETAWRMNVKTKIREFLEKDENSTIAPGARDSITIKKETFQKRYLTDTLDNLYKQFSAVSDLKVSRATFFRFKPGWIMAHEASARDTCLCKEHTNCKFLLEKLASLKILPSSKSLEFIESVTCDPKNKTCMYREFIKCKHQVVPAREHDEPCSFYRWETKSVTRRGAKGAMHTVKLTEKNKIDTTVTGLVH